MCDASVIVFGATRITAQEVRGKRVLEVGSCIINGSLRPIIECWGVAEYVGCDITQGPGVDVLCGADEIVRVFGESSFDVVIATELLEHVRNWKTTVSNMKRACVPGGLIVITTRSKGFKYHGHPYDFWRYELSDMTEIFSDCEILDLQPDPTAPGVFLKARKKDPFHERDLSQFELFNIVTGKRVQEICERDLRTFRFHLLTTKEFLMRWSARGLRILFG
jgi:SAM-dependent methyltransferase